MWLAEFEAQGFVQNDYEEFVMAFMVGAATTTESAVMKIEQEGVKIECLAFLVVNGVPNCQRVSTILLMSLDLIQLGRSLSTDSHQTLTVVCHQQVGLRLVGPVML